MSDILLAIIAACSSGTDTEMATCRLKVRPCVHKAEAEIKKHSDKSPDSLLWVQIAQSCAEDPDSEWLLFPKGGAE